MLLLYNIYKKIKGYNRFILSKCFVDSFYMKYAYGIYWDYVLKFCLKLQVVEYILLPAAFIIK